MILLLKVARIGLILDDQGNCFFILPILILIFLYQDDYHHNLTDVSLKHCHLDDFAVAKSASEFICFRLVFRGDREEFLDALGSNYGELFHPWVLNKANYNDG